jgi:hypothetical protein
VIGDAFWGMTPWELRTIIESEGERLEDEYRSALNVAWHGAGFQRSKKLPDLKKIMRRRDRQPVKRAVDEHALMAVMLAHNARVRREKSGDGQTR